MAPAAAPSLTQQLATARLATAKYATNLGRAKADGYQIITKMMPNMGFHFMNPKMRASTSASRRSWSTSTTARVAARRPGVGVPEDARRPAAAERHVRLVPGGLPLRGRHLHPGRERKTCPKRAPHTGARFTFWHPDLVTMHVWVWYPNPAGLYSSTNPLVAPFNRG